MRQFKTKHRLTFLYCVRYNAQVQYIIVRYNAQDVFEIIYETAKNRKKPKDCPWKTWV